MREILEGFRDKNIGKNLADRIASYDGPKISIMEVCGTHTMSIARYGIRSILPDSIRLVSGPGCPVCVTPGYYIGSSIELAGYDDVIIATFGDLMRIPFKDSCLLKEKSEGRDIRVVYSPLECISLALDNPLKKIVFLSVGFETTIPVSALLAINTLELGIKNLYLLTANKTIPEALKLLSSDKDIGIDGFIYPGHVSAVIGDMLYKEIAECYAIGGVITGFDPLDILGAIIRLIDNISARDPRVENLYSRIVKPEGNIKAINAINEVFEKCDSIWRGLGLIKGSGLMLREKYRHMDAWNLLDSSSISYDEPKGCICGEILKGKATPDECSLFGKTCTPLTPVGSCMVSSEGTCAAYQKYNI
ncbi:MAG: hydrogenase formation protein HypD [Clostridiaceae bacterium]|nr:hydrogenase formation protein HypD [Clostridiaceae bacterium]